MSSSSSFGDRRSETGSDSASSERVWASVTDSQRRDCEAVAHANSMLELETRPRTWAIAALSLALFLGLPLLSSYLAIRSYTVNHAPLRWGLVILALLGSFVSFLGLKWRLFDRLLCLAIRPREQNASIWVLGAVLFLFLGALGRLAWNIRAFGHLRIESPWAYNAIVALVPSLAILAAAATSSVIWTVRRLLKHHQMERPSWTSSAPEHALVALHLSDLHLLEPNVPLTTEGGSSCFFCLPRDLSAYNCVLLTGDITDTGKPGEWARFHAWRDECRPCPPPLILCPGNHDLNMWSAPGDTNHDWLKGPKSSYMTEGLAKSVRKWLFWREVDREARRLSVAEYFVCPHGGEVRRWTEFFTAEVCEGLEGSSPDMLASRARTIWDNTFPYAVRLIGSKSHWFFVLDSNDESSAGVLDNAYGVIHAPAVERLERLIGCARKLEGAEPVSMTILLHHHVSDPTENVRQLWARDSILDRVMRGAMSCYNADALLSLAGSVGAAVLHGHTHFPDFGDVRVDKGRVRVVSAGSATFPGGSPHRVLLWRDQERTEAVQEAVQARCESCEDLSERWASWTGATGGLYRLHTLVAQRRVAQGSGPPTA